MSINFPISRNFESTSFQDLANNVGIGSGNVVNTDYIVIAKPTWGDYIINFFLSFFNPQNFDYNVDRIFKQIESDIGNTLSQYLLKMAENPGVDSKVVEAELLAIDEAIQIVGQDDEMSVDFDRGKITLNNNIEFILEKQPEMPKEKVSKAEVEEAVKEAFNAHRKSFSQRANLSEEQIIFMNLQEGQYEIKGYKRAYKDSEWKLEITFTAPNLGVWMQTSTCSLENFPHDMLNLPGDPIVAPFTKEEILGALELKKAAVEEQLKQPVIDYSEKFFQEVERLRVKVRPLITGIIARKNAAIQGSGMRLLTQWNLLTDKILSKEFFTIKAKEVEVKYHTTQNMDLLMDYITKPMSTIIADWSDGSRFGGDLSGKKVTFLEPVAII
ncbi:MAG: hypothetical protein H0T62_08075 [Parachlamydiaceae bacterium]|nr:hypothetical protein [Parachlamydiaceae bacterium]